MRGVGVFLLSAIYCVAGMAAAPSSFAREVEQAIAQEAAIERQRCLEAIETPLPDAARQRAACTGFLRSVVGETAIPPRELADAHLSRALAAGRLGQAGEARRDYRQAAELYGEGIERQPSDGVVLWRRAMAWHGLGEIDRALADYDGAVQHGLRRADLFVNRGLLLSNARNDYRRALADFDEAARLEPANAYPAMLCGEMHSLLGERALALADFDRAETLARQSLPASGQAEVLTMRGLANARGGDGAAASADYDRALALDAGNVDALLNRAAIAAGAGRHADALDDLGRVLKLQPANVTALFNRGVSRFALGDYRGAVADYDSALLAAPDLAIAYANRCLARVVLGDDLAGARVDCREALRRQPQRADLHEIAAFLHLKLGEAADAQAEYDQALDLQPGRPIALWGRGTAKLRLGDRMGGEADRRAAQAAFAGVEGEFTKYGIR